MDLGTQRDTSLVIGDAERLQAVGMDAMPSSEACTAKMNGRRAAGQQ